MDITELFAVSFRRLALEGQPEIGSTIAYEDTASPTGWDFGVVKMIDRSIERLNYVVASPTGWLVVNRGRVFRWWSLA